MMFDVANDQSGATHAWMKVEEGYITIEDNTPSKDDERMIDVLFTNKVDYLGYNFGETIYDFRHTLRKFELKWILMTA